MKVMKMRLTAAGLISILFLTACEKENNTGVTPSFDRKAMLEYYADQVIVPAYTQLVEKTAALQTAWSNFKNEPSESTLLALQDGWKTAALAWQAANAFNFGPAGEAGIRKGLIEEIGTFPVAVNKVENYIAAGDAGFNNFDRDSRGFYALEYLIFGQTDRVLTALQAGNRQQYASALVQDLVSEAQGMVSSWASYRSGFVSNAGTDAGSSTSQLYNAFVQSFEAIKNFKVGLPAGKRAGQTQAAPELVEARFSGYSLALLRAHLEAIDAIYQGKSLSGQDGAGLMDYLLAVEGGPALVNATRAQWQSVMAALDKIPAGQTLEVAIAAGDPSVDALHTELQKHTRFFKSDMSSLLGIAITFASGDGD